MPTGLIREVAAIAKKMFNSVKTDLWGVFYVGNAWGMFRSLKAAFAEKKDAEAWAKKWSEENFCCTMMVEEIKVTIPAWDGTVPDQSRCTADQPIL